MPSKLLLLLANLLVINTLSLLPSFDPMFENLTQTAQDLRNISSHLKSFTFFDDRRLIAYVFTIFLGSILSLAQLDFNFYRGSAKALRNFYV